MEQNIGQFELDEGATVGGSKTLFSSESTEKEAVLCLHLCGDG